MALTPAEQLFFDTGDASVLNVDPDPAAPAPAPAPNPLVLNGLSTDPPPAPPAPAAPAPAPAPQHGPDGKFIAATPAAPAPAPAPDANAEALRQSISQMQQQLAELRQAATQPPAPAAPAPQPAPDPEKDPYGALLHNLKTLQAEITSLKQTHEQTKQQTESQRQFEAFQTTVVNMRNEFVKTTPDFMDAYQHLVQTRTADLQAMGLNQKQINETLFREEVALSENALRQGKNPAQVAYETAQRHGYARKAAPTPPAPPAPSGGPSAEDIQRAQAASRQMPSAPPVGEPDLTAEGLRQASEADLNKLVTNDAMWLKLTQGERYPL